MLRFPEELMLLMLDDENGTFARVPDRLLRYALAGGVLMDLALEDRIDTDLEKLILVSSEPLKDSLLDPTLADIAQATETHDARFWVERTARLSAEAIRREALNRLVDRGILECRDDRFLWVFRARRYPAIDGTAEREVKLRIMEILFSDLVPLPRDVVIIGLAHACDLFRQILSDRELANVATRIDEVRQLDLISRAMSQAILDIELSIALAVQTTPY